MSTGCCSGTWLLVCLAAFGCSRDAGVAIDQPAPDDPSCQNLSKILDAYLAARHRLGYPPRGPNDLKPHLKQYGDPEVILRSPRDGEPYVILWGTDLDDAGVASSEEAPAVYIHEKRGADGKRYVVTVETQIWALTDEQFAKAKFPKPRKS